MKKILITFLVIFSATILYQQECNLDFHSPINYKTKLSGSYGEPRSKHFHAGIDYKQNRGIPRDSIFAVEEGYVSRISVQPDGYGNALYINHDCNKTSVYAHLYKYAPEIDRYIRDTLTALQSYSIHHQINQDVFPVKKGDFIGILGSTGRSSGPHLHFEIRNTATERPINPALFGFKPKDNIPPAIGGIMLYELSPDNQELSKVFYKASKKDNNTYKLPQNVLTTGALKFGVGLRAYDTMNGARNHNGIYSLEMKVDGKDSYSFSMDSISFDESKYIHSHMDFEEKLDNKYVTKCFKNPGNKLNIYKTDTNYGTIAPFEFRDTKIEIEIKDIEGNSALINFSIRRVDSLRYPEFKSDFIKVGVDDSLTLDLGNSKLTLFKETFCQPTNLKFNKISGDSILLKQNIRVPLFKSFKLVQTISNLRYDKKKYTFLSKNKKGETERFRGKWESDSTMVTFLESFKDYWVGIDTIPPTVYPTKLPGAQSKRVEIRIQDNFLPVHDLDFLKFDVFLDGIWTLCQHDTKSNSVWFEMEGNRNGTSHILKILVSDASENQKSLTKRFTY